MSHVIIAAGGTGGHIFPGLALARALKELDPQLNIHFVGARGGMEARIIPAEGFAQTLLPIGRLNHNIGWGERIKTLFQLPVAIFMSMRLVWKLRPRFVLGVGGHSSAPILLAAWLLRVPTVIWEPNAIPGLANRWLSRFVDHALVAFAAAKRYLRAKNIQEVGIPVRAEIEAAPRRLSDASAKTFHVLVFGGSQGAKGINTAVVNLLKSQQPVANKIQLVHQSGPADLDRLRELYGDLVGDVVEIKDFLNDMPARYEWADVVISRGGTGTISELAACGKPAILIPLPTAADNHQQKNAEALVAAGGAVMILQKDLSVESLSAALEKILSSAEQRRAMSTAIATFHRPHAAREIASWLLELGAKK